MAKFADLKGLNNFRQKIQKIKITDSTIKKILNKVASTSIDYARQIYGQNNIELYAEISANKMTLYAEGDEVAYIEFGTGERGNGTYEGNLPEDTIAFYSTKFGRDIILDYGWTYSYANKLDENQPLWNGFEAKAYMWKTAQYMRNIVPQIINEVLSSEGIY